MTFHHVRQKCFLNLGAMFKKFLDNLKAGLIKTKGSVTKTCIIAKDILNKLKSILWNDFVEYHLLFFASGSFQFLLNKSRPVLVTAKLYDKTKYIL